MPKKRVSDTIPPEAYAYYMFHPIEFVQEQILKLTPEEIKADKVNKRLEPQTKLILDAVNRFDYISIHSGRGVTKTTALAFLAIWWCWSRNDSRVMATGPKYDNLKATLWAEIAKWLDFSNVKDKVILTGERIYNSDKEMHAFGQMMTTKDKENISGVHATHVLWLVDEASNMEKEIIDAILGGMNDPENKIVMTGNPTRASGPFYDTHYKDKKYWHRIRLSTEDSARKNKVWYERMCRHPRESDIFRVNVLGLPPLGNPQAIITLADCHAAKDRNVPTGEYLEMAIDPAREGTDLATIGIRQGLKTLEIRKFPKTKGPVLIGHTLKMLREYRRKTGIKSKVKIKIDDHGIGGPIGDELALNEEDNIEVIPCLFGGAGNEQYQDSATIMWFNMADIIETIELPDDEELIEQLSTREWRPGNGRKLKVEPKKEYKERTGNGCDEADCCIMLYYAGPKKIFESLDQSEQTTEINTRFVIDWNYDRLMDPTFNGVFMIDVLHLGALVLNDDLSVDGLAAVYQHYVDKLWVYAQFHWEHPEPDVMAIVAKSQTRKGMYDDDRDIRFYGNERIFSSKENRAPLADVIAREGLYLIQPEKYDEYGAIAIGVKMFNEGHIIMHTNLEDARKAVALWVVKAGKPEADKNGFGKALLLILSEVRRRKKQQPVIQRPRDYRPVRKVITEGPDYSAWMRR